MYISQDFRPSLQKYFNKVTQVKNRSKNMIFSLNYDDDDTKILAKLSAIVSLTKTRLTIINLNKDVFEYTNQECTI